MHSNWWLTTLAVGEVGGLVVAISMLLRKRLVSRWPSLMTALILELTTDLAFTWLMSHQGHYKVYFYTYWIAAGVQAVLRVWIIGDILRSFPNIDFLPSSLYLFVGTAGATMAAASAAYVFHANANAKFAQDMVFTVMQLNRCVTVAWATFAATLLFAAKRLNLGWSPQGARVASAAFVRIAVTAVVAELFAKKAINLRLLGNGLESICSIAVFLSWAYTIARYPVLPDHEVEEVITPQVRQNLGELLLLSRER